MRKIAKNRVLRITAVLGSLTGLWVAGSAPIWQLF